MVRRGFASHAERLAVSVRAELGLEVDDRFDPRHLADEYGVPITPITDLIAEGASPESIYQLTSSIQEASRPGRFWAAAPG